MLTNRLRCHRNIIFRLCRNLCDKIDTESSAVTSENDEKAKTKKQAAANKLTSLLEQLNVEAQSPLAGRKPSITLNLAKPVVKERKLKKKDQNTLNIVKEPFEKIEPELVSAARSVAKDLGGDIQRTESELITKLRGHAQETAKSKMKFSGSLRNMFSGMKIASNDTKDVKSSLPEFKQIPSQTEEELIEAKQEDEDTEIEESELLQKMRAHMKGKTADEENQSESSGSKMSRLFLGVKVEQLKKAAPKRFVQQSFMDDGPFDDSRRRKTPDREARSQIPRTVTPMHVPMGERVHLFRSEPLNWFKMKDDVEANADYPVLNTWDALQKHALKLLTSHPPKNAYEEIIAWTDQGKMWKFPIDNEQGLDEEAKIRFDQHVFLEPHLDGFPETGPIRHFMELVIVGLSKNPYITVQRKIEHIEWYRDYFREKETVLRETGAITEPIQLKAIV